MNRSMRLLPSGLFLAVSGLMTGCLPPTGEKDGANPQTTLAMAASGSSVSWHQKSFDNVYPFAKEIGAGAADGVFALLNDNQANGSHTLIQRTTTGWVATTGTGFEIDVGAKVQGVSDVWLIGSNRKMYMSVNNGGTWRTMSAQTFVELGVNTSGQVWALGTETVSGTQDRALYRLDYGSNDWIRSSVNGAGGVRLDVDPVGCAWVIKANGQIWRTDSQGTTFTQVGTQLATDIGVGGNGMVWIIGTNTVSTNGDKDILYWNGSGWTTVNGGAKRITADENGNPWIVNSWDWVYQGTF